MTKKNEHITIEGDILKQKDDFENSFICLKSFKE